MKHSCIRHLRKKCSSIFFLTAIPFIFNSVASAQNKQAGNPGLYVSLSAGSTGLGIGIEAPVNSRLGVRGGFDFVPYFEKISTFTMTAGADYSDTESQKRKFEKMSGKLTELTGMEFDRYIDMVETPSFKNFHITADIYPFRNRNWRFSTGLYWSPSKTIGHAENATYDAPALVSTYIYNDLYARAINSYENFEPMLYLSGEPIYAGEDLYNSFQRWGMAGFFVGDSIDGGAYMMYPDHENCMVSADMTVNRLKPYIGFGYEGPLIKSDDRYTVSFDCGILMWGGTPSVVTHEGVDIVHDLEKVNGQLRSYVNIVKKLPVYPLIKITVSRKLF